PTERHPACRQREARPGSCTERENLAGDAKGKAQAAPTVRLKVPMRRRGADCLVVVRWHEPDDARVSRPESVRGSGRNSLSLLGKMRRTQGEESESSVPQ